MATLLLIVVVSDFFLQVSSYTGIEMVNTFSVAVFPIKMAGIGGPFSQYMEYAAIGFFTWTVTIFLIVTIVEVYEKLASYRKPAV